MPRKPGAKNGDAAIPFDGEKPQYKNIEIEVNKRFAERLTNYEIHYKEVKGTDCDLGILVGNIVNEALNRDSSFVQKENSGHFNGSSESSSRPASRSASTRTPD